MSKKPPSRRGLLWWFLSTLALAFLYGLIRLRGHWNILPLYMGGAALCVVVYILMKLALVMRKRRLWIEDRRARGLKIYEQPRDAISNNTVVRWILFLPKQKPIQP
jgi:hypothetical protein